MTRMVTVTAFCPEWLSRGRRRRDGRTQSARRRGQQSNLLFLSASALVVLTAANSSGGIALAATNQMLLHSFNGANGDGPEAGLLMDAVGNLYGTTYSGGANGAGAIFELSPPAAGKMTWRETVLHSFNSTDGAEPVEGLIADAAGNFYGTTSIGGAIGGGVLFQLSPPASGAEAWTETVLYSFGGSNGIVPTADLIADQAGNLYGTTRYGGAHRAGVVFQISPPTSGRSPWTETVLFSFIGTKGRYPFAGLITDGAGNLYGTTHDGGKYGAGVVFELTPPAAGQTIWTEKVLHSFNLTKGQNSCAGLIADAAGNLYGTTYGGGSHGDGVVFELTPPTGVQSDWAENVLYSFNGNRGAGPQGSLIADGAGNLFGTTKSGGAYGYGVVFKLTPPAAGHSTWSQTVIHSFNGTKGQDPYARLIMDSGGSLYGTTELGGASGEGVVFKLTP